MSCVLCATILDNVMMLTSTGNVVYVCVHSTASVDIDRGNDLQIAVMVAETISLGVLSLPAAVATLGLAP